MTKTYILRDRDQVSLAPRAVTVTVSASGASSSDIVLTPVADVLDPRTRSPRGGQLILPTIIGRTTVQVTGAVEGARFGTGTGVTITLRLDQTAGSDEEHVVIRNADLGGRVVREVVELEVAEDGRLTITALEVVTDPALDPLAEAARAAARAHLRCDRTPGAVSLRVAVDMSASMDVAVRDGSLAAAVDVVAGLSHVVGADKRAGTYRKLEVCLVTDRPVPLPGVPAKDLAKATLEQVGRTGRGCGFSSTATGPPAGGSVTYIITDAVPPDIAALRAAHRPDDVRHLVLVDPALGSGFGSTGGSPPGSDVPMSVFPAVPPGTPAGEYLLRHPDVLATLVASLVAGFAQAAAGTEVGR